MDSSTLRWQRSVYSARVTCKEGRVTGEEEEVGGRGKRREGDGGRGGGREREKERRE